MAVSFTHEISSNMFQFSVKKILKSVLKLSYSNKGEITFLSEIPLKTQKFPSLVYSKVPLKFSSASLCNYNILYFVFSEDNILQYILVMTQYFLMKIIFKFFLLTKTQLLSNFLIVSMMESLFDFLSVCFIKKLLFGLESYYIYI